MGEHYNDVKSFGEEVCNDDESLVGGTLCSRTCPLGEGSVTNLTERNLAPGYKACFIVCNELVENFHNVCGDHR